MSLKDNIAANNARRANDPKAAQEAAQTAHTQATTTNTNVNIEEGKAKLPYTAPTAKTTLESGQQNVQFTPLEQSGRELKDFKGRKNVLIYETAVPMMATALQTKATPGDDKELVMLAAKIQDPEGSVREGDEQRFNNVEVALDHIPQQFKKEFLQNGGNFTDEGREAIRAFLLRRVNNYRTAYLNDRKTVTDRIDRSNARGPVQIDPLDAVGPDIQEAFLPIFEGYQKRLGTKEEQTEEAKTVGAFQAPPEGTHIAGENIKGWRLSRDAEADITNYLRQPDSTAEGYAQMVAEKAIDEGHITPEEAPGLIKATTPAMETYLAGFKTPEDKAKIPASIDYSSVDKMAQANATPLDVMGQAFQNLPESGAQLIEGAARLPLDPVVGALQGERRGVVKVVPDLIGDVLTGGGDTSKATLQMLKDRYGGAQQLQDTLATDPLGLAADVSPILGGVGKLKGLSKVAELGRIIDPITGSRAVAERVLPTIRNTIPQTIRDLPGNAVRGAGGLLTGVPGESTRRLGRVGRERGRAGVTSPEYENVVGDLRGRGDPTEIIDSANASVAEMRRQASDAYRSGMVDVSRDATVLDFAPIDTVLNNLRGRAYFRGQVKNPRAAQVLQEATDIIDDWKALDPAQFHTPEGMDALKQRLGDLVENHRTSGDRASANIANGVYREVRKVVADQVPTYAATMRAYEEASDLTRQIEKTFSLNPNASVDTQLRKLQSITRNNANTSYGYRQTLGDLMEQYGGRGMLDRLAGQSMSSPRPRGLQGMTGGIGTLTGGAMTLSGTGGMLGPAMLGLLPLTIPRVTGEIALGAGRVAGEAERLGSRVINAPGISDVGKWLADNQQRYPTAAVGTTALGSRMQDVQQHERAATTPAPAPTPAISPEVPVDRFAGATVDPETGEVILADGTRVPAPKTMAYGGAVRRLGQKYGCGGGVRPYG